MAASDAKLGKREDLSRVDLAVRGQVQGVGFRPFVFRIARQFHISGWVLNDFAGARIQAQGTLRQLSDFESALVHTLPSLAVIRGIDRRILPAVAERGFRIGRSVESVAQPSQADVAVDSASCADCVRELLDPADRRFHYPLINCTQCGPRFSIIARTPYDRCNTSMASFRMCRRCRRDYQDPCDRRYHAQPIACHDCGPQIHLLNSTGEPSSGDPIVRARLMLRDGQILAIKGLGAFHLAVRADRGEAVQRLRELKHRRAKPLAVMVGSIEQARGIVRISARGQSLLHALQAPILLCDRLNNSAICAEVAPGNHRLGVMLPYTPLHHLLFATPDFPPLIMTSGNDSGEPLIIEDGRAVAELRRMCDGFLLHDRPILRGVDDSVLVDAGDDPPIMLRRARGYVPTPIVLPTRACADGIAIGSELKSAIACVRRGEAILSQHLGDLSQPDTFALLQHTVADFEQLFGVEPKWIAHDLHPGYLSAHVARSLASKRQLHLVPVQHHHAHAAAVLAEHGLSGPALAVVCDGTGYGTDGTIWGGELLLADLHGFRRLAHLAQVRLPGGDASALDPRRSAAAVLHQALGKGFERSRAFKSLGFDDREQQMLPQMIQNNVACVASSSAGRLFDAVAVLTGICRTNLFESQAPMALESAAHEFGPLPPAGRPMFVFRDDGAIDLSKLIHELLARQERGVCAQELAAFFHEEFAQAWAAVVARFALDHGVNLVALTGGVFCNARLTCRLTELLHDAKLKVLRHVQVPPNDGGLALGQAAVAAAKFQVERTGA